MDIDSDSSDSSASDISSSEEETADMLLDNSSQNALVNCSKDVNNNKVQRHEEVSSDDDEPLAFLVPLNKLK